ncbi:MAG: efflux RND transporter periplasmic adaptor subunit, partial [Halioglobus sp.]|nr:efflux RND transporter periplasmic adaptor subunit [Halioglobus sp.]
ALRASEADLEAAQLDLARTVISAPFNGRVSEKHVDVGQFVTAGTPVATVYGTDAVEVRLPLTGRQVALLELPLTYEEDSASGVDSGARVMLEAGFANQQWKWQGRIVRTDASIDENSRLVYAVAEVQKPFARAEGSERPPLSPGLFVNASISGKPLPQVARLPRTALHSGDTVMLVDADEIARKRPVHVLHSDADSVWVQGLEAGERVMVREVPRVVAGAQVRINHVAQTAAAAPPTGAEE